MFYLLLFVVIFIPMIALGIEMEDKDGKLIVVSFILFVIFFISIRCLFSLWAEREKEIEIQRLIILDYIEKENKNGYSID